MNGFHPTATHPLGYWLSSELAKVTPPEASSRLRRLVDAQGQRLSIAGTFRRKELAAK